jgi:hypothetical protein
MNANSSVTPAPARLREGSGQIRAQREKQYENREYNSPSIEALDPLTRLLSHTVPLAPAIFRVAPMTHDAQAPMK